MWDQDEILSGCINISGLITAEVTKEYEESTVSKILDLVENASSKKSQSEQFITKFARYYTPVVVILAVLLAVLPPLIVKGEEFSEWTYRALSFLVVSCPCALAISIPLTFFSGIGGASKKGILIKGSNYFEALANTEIMVFDKTGTLTKGVFEVQEIYSTSISKEELIELVAHAESISGHPISKSILKAYGKEKDQSIISEAYENAGHGVEVVVNGKKIIAGNAKLMKLREIDYIDKKQTGTVVHVAIDGIYSGYILIADEIRKDSHEAIKNLKALI